MNAENDDSELLPEKALPQISIRFLLGLVASCALMMWVLRGAYFNDWFWAKCASVVLLTVMGCFLLYVVLFVFAAMFAALTGAVVQPTGYREHTLTSPKTYEHGVKE